MHVVICVSHTFCSTDLEKETAHSLILSHPINLQAAEAAVKAIGCGKKEKEHKVLF